MLKKVLAAAIKLSLQITAILTLVGLLLLRSVLTLMRTDALILQDCLSYGYVIFGGLFAASAYNLCAAILRACGDSKTPFLAVCISAVLNIILDFISIYVLRMGIAGPAYATVLSQAVSTILCFYKLHNHRNIIQDGLKSGCIIATAAALMLGIVLLMFPEPLAKMMLTGNEAIALTASFLQIFAFLLIFLNLLFVFRSCVQSINKPFLPLLSGFAATAYAEGIAWIGALSMNAAAYFSWTRKQQHVLSSAYPPLTNDCYDSDAPRKLP